MFTRSRWLLGVFLVFGGLTVASTTAAAPKDLSLADRHFLTDAAEGSIAEARLGQAALEKSMNNDVKEFGRRMVTDHTKAGNELTALGKERGVTLPRDMGPKHRKIMATLAALNGSEFDRAYMEDMVRDHADDVAAFQKQAQEGMDPTLRAWAAKTLPTLQDHLKMARDVAGKVGAKIPK